MQYAISDDAALLARKYFLGTRFLLKRHHGHARCDKGTREEEGQDNPRFSCQFGMQCIMMRSSACYRHVQIFTRIGNPCDYLRRNRAHCCITVICIREQRWLKRLIRERSTIRASTAQHIYIYIYIYNVCTFSQALKHATIPNSLRRFHKHTIVF